MRFCPSLPEAILGVCRAWPRVRACPCVTKILVDRSSSSPLSPTPLPPFVCHCPVGTRCFPSSPWSLRSASWRPARPGSPAWPAGTSAPPTPSTRTSPSSPSRSGTAPPGAPGARQPRAAHSFSRWHSSLCVLPTAPAALLLEVFFFWLRKKAEVLATCGHLKGHGVFRNVGVLA